MPGYDKQLIGGFSGGNFNSLPQVCLRLFRIVSCLLILASSPRAMAETLTIPGSGNPYHILTVLAQAFNSRQSEHLVLVPISTGTAGAIRDVTGGIASVGRVGRALTTEERNKGLEYLSLGRDPIVFVGGAKVTATTITREQAFGVLEGRLLNWRDLGGEAGTIRAIGREASDASLLGLRRELPDFEHLVYGADVKVVHFDHHLLELLDRYPYSFGFLNRSGLLGAKTRLVVLDFETKDPSAENVATGRYPFWTELGLIYKRSLLSDAGQAFLQFVQSAEGLRILRDNGVFPVSERK